MFIQTADTPNPQSMKFLPGQAVLGPGKSGMDFPAPEAADGSPMAKALFHVDGVSSVYLGSDFVTVTKDPNMDWAHLKPAILGTIADFLTAGLPIVDPSTDESQAATGSAEDYEGEDKEIVEQIIDLIETRVRPAVAQDGGDIVFHRWEKEGGLVFLTMKGACAGCPSSTMTLKSGIENLLKHYIPEINSVEAVG
ncbi:MAG: NifU family protein [Parvularcula sp.]